MTAPKIILNDYRKKRSKEAKESIEDMHRRLPISHEDFARRLKKLKETEKK